MLSTRCSKTVQSYAVTLLSLLCRVPLSVRTIAPVEVLWWKAPSPLRIDSLAITKATQRAS